MLEDVLFPSTMTEPDLEKEIGEIGRSIWASLQKHRRPMRRAEDRAMAMLSATPGLQAAAFRLVDVAPACDRSLELAEHLTGYLDQVPDQPRTISTASRVLRNRVGAVAGGRAAKLAVRGMADRFIVGETVSAAVPVFTRMWRDGTAATVDLLGEATVTQAEGQAYASRCESALRTLHAAAVDWPARPLLERDGGGQIPRVNLSVKVTALTALVRAHAPARGMADAEQYLVSLLRTARELGAHLHIDMESLDSRELILSLVLDLLSRDEFADGPSAGIVLQAYLTDSEEILGQVLEWARQSGRTLPLTIRLVKGAYWDREVIDAAHHGWPAPVWTEKRETDRCYERLTRQLIDAFPLVRPAIASHNVRSLAHAMAYARSRGLDPGDVELQVLRGLGDDLQRALAAEGRRCRTYCPVGDMVAGMAYLVRRLLENTANDSFLSSQAAGVDIADLLRAP